MENKKPMTLVREDFITAVAMLINQSNLPLFVVEDILKQLTNEVSTLAKQQLETDRQTYSQIMAMEQNESFLTEETKE